MLLSAIWLLVIGSCKKIDMPNEAPLIIKDSKNITITQLRQLSVSPVITLPEGLQISGTVISDVAAGNIEDKTIVLQGLFTDSAGIVITFDKHSGFQSGDNLSINVGGQRLEQRNGELILSGIPFSKATKTFGGLTVIPHKLSVRDVRENAAAWNGRLVSFYEGTLTGGNGQYGGELSFTELDSTRPIVLKILPGATFANSSYPSRLNNLTGILRMDGNKPYIQIRNTTDVDNAAITRHVTEDMAGLKWPASLSADYGSPDLFTGGSMETRTLPYSSGAYLLGYIKPFTTDATFLSDKKWFYIFDGLSDYGSAGIILSGTNLSGIKQVKCTFAASKVTGLITTTTWGEEINAPMFNSSTDKIQIRLEGSVEDTSAIFKETGKFYTVTFNIPTRSQLIAAAKKKYSDADWPSYSAYELEQIKRVLDAPKLQLYNWSTRAAGGDIPWAPVIISKMEYGF